MRGVRKLILLATLGFTSVLAILSVVGAFLGAEDARAMFNSPALIVLWVLFTALLLTGFLYFKTLIRAPGALLCHVGVVLVLVGAMRGSHGGQDLAATYLGVERIPEGYMRIFEGQASDVLTDGAGQVIGTLPFRIRLEDFWIEHYDDPGPWRLGVDAPPLPGQAQRRMAEIIWQEGEVEEIPFLGATVEVLQYLPSAHASYAEGAVPMLEVVEVDGRRSVTPARVGAEIQLGEGAGTLRIARVFGHLQIRAGEVIDIPGSDANPALLVLWESPDGSTSRLYAFARDELAAHAHGSAGPQLHYVLPAQVEAVADSTTGLPAMEVRIRGARGEDIHAWIVARDAEQPAVLPLTGLAGDPDSADWNDARAARAYLILVGAQGMISDYKSRLTVVDDAGEPQATQVIEVNDPLHYGGYHFYQHSYDSRQGRFTILGVRSDAGLNIVYAGFACVCLGVFWIFWWAPLWRHVKGGA